MQKRINPRRVATFLCVTFSLWSVFGIAPSHAVDHPDRFSVTSPNFTDNGMLTSANAGTGTSPRGPWDCGGRDISPALSWSHAPTGTKSFAIIMDDPDAASGAGFATGSSTTFLPT